MREIDARRNEKNRKAQARAASRRRAEERDRRAERVEAARSGRPLVEQVEDCVTPDRVEFRMEGRLIGYAQGPGDGRADGGWHGAADLPDRLARASGDRERVVSTLKREIKEAHNARISVKDVTGSEAEPTAPKF